MIKRYKRGFKRRGQQSLVRLGGNNKDGRDEVEEGAGEIGSPPVHIGRSCHMTLVEYANKYRWQMERKCIGVLMLVYGLPLT